MNRLIILAPCFMGLWAGAVLAQDCTDSTGMGEQYWNNREKIIGNQYEMETWKASSDKSAMALIKKNLLDRITFSTAYGDGYQISTEGTGVIFNPKEQNDWTWSIKYEVPLGNFFPESTPQSHPNKEYFKDSAKAKAKIEFDNLISDWRIANSALERKKAELESKTNQQDKKIAAWAVEEARYSVEKIRNQISNLSGTPVSFNTCI